MKIQSVENVLRRLIGKGRGLMTMALAFMFTVALPALAQAQTSISDIGDSAKTELDKVVPVLVPVGGAIILIAAGIATVLVVLRLTKKA